MCIWAASRVVSSSNNHWRPLATEAYQFSKSWDPAIFILIDRQQTDRWTKPISLPLAHARRLIILCSFQCACSRSIQVRVVKSYRSIAEAIILDIPLHVQLYCSTAQCTWGMCSRELYLYFLILFMELLEMWHIYIKTLFWRFLHDLEDQRALCRILSKARVLQSPEGF